MILFSHIISRIKYVFFFYKLSRKNKINIKGKLYKVIFDIDGKDNIIEIKKNCGLQNLLIKIKGNNHHLIIEADVNIKKGVIWFEDNNNSIFIDKYTTIEEAHIAVTEPNHKIYIGMDCMLSHGITIRTGDSHSIIDTISGKRVNYAKDIIIDDHVWIGANVAIMKGVKINKNSVIGINSVVTKEVAENSLVAGIPAKMIKENVTWNRKRIYE